MKPNVFTYWEGPKPDWIDLCLRSMQQAFVGCDVHIVTPESAGSFGVDSILHPAWRSLAKPAHRADALRAALLALYGGFYMDADTIGMACPAHLASHHDLVYCTWDRSPRRVLNGNVYARPASPLAGEWVDAVNRTIANGGGAGWTSMGEGILTPLVDSGRFNTMQIPRDTFLPIDIDSHVRAFFHPKDFAPVMAEHTVAFGLNHSWMMHHHRQAMTVTPAEMAASPLMIHRLLTAIRRRLGDGV